jgi:hypothetical protein
MLLYNCNIVTGLVQNENVFQLLINLFIFAPISWYIDMWGCKPPLIEIFIYKIFFRHPPWYIKVPKVSKFVKLWQFYLHCSVLSPLGISIQWVQSCLSQQDDGKAKRISNHHLSHVFYFNNMMLSINHTLHTYLSIHFALCALCFS